MALGATIATLTVALPCRYTARIRHEGVISRYIAANACRRAPVMLVASKQLGHNARDHILRSLLNADSAEMATDGKRRDAVHQ